MFFLKKIMADELIMSSGLHNEFDSCLTCGIINVQDELFILYAKSYPGERSLMLKEVAAKFETVKNQQVKDTCRKMISSIDKIKQAGSFFRHFGHMARPKRSRTLLESSVPFHVNNLVACLAEMNTSFYQKNLPKPFHRERPSSEFTHLSAFELSIRLRDQLIYLMGLLKIEFQTGQPTKEEKLEVPLADVYFSDEEWIDAMKKQTTESLLRTKLEYGTPTIKPRQRKEPVAKIRQKKPIARDISKATQNLSSPTPPEIPDSKPSATNPTSSMPPEIPESKPSATVKPSLSMVAFSEIPEWQPPAAKSPMSMLAFSEIPEWQPPKVIKSSLSMVADVPEWQPPVTALSTIAEQGLTLETYKKDGHIPFLMSQLLTGLDGSFAGYKFIIVKEEERYVTCKVQGINFLKMVSLKTRVSYEPRVDI